MQVCTIIMEPTEKLPLKEYLVELRKVATKNKCILIFDEITSGWRLNTGRTHLKFKVNPDVVVYGKTISNGIPMAALIGKKKIIDFSLKSFISSSFWTERVGPSCAITFIKKHQKLKLGDRLNKIGQNKKYLETCGKNNLSIELME